MKGGTRMKLEDVKALTAQLSAVPTPDQEKKYQELLQSLGIEPGGVYQELEMTSRYVDTHQDISFSNSAMNLHSHTFIEILAVRSSGGAEYLVGAERYRLQRGDIIIVPPGDSHRPLLPESLTEPYKRDVLWVSTEFMKGLIQNFPEDGLLLNTDSRLLRTAGTKWAYLTDIIHRGVREAEGRKQGWEMAVVANTVQLMVHFHRAIADKAANTMKAEKKELMDNVLGYVEKHYAEKLTLSDIAGRFYVSESTISQTFRKKMGVSFYHWVTQRRLIAAKLLIEEGKLLEEVAETVGFTDYSSFFRAFKQEFGISPRQYRKMQ